MQIGSVRLSGIGCNKSINIWIYKEFNGFIELYWMLLDDILVPDEGEWDKENVHTISQRTP